jgi:hypothetical protein
MKVFLLCLLTDESFARDLQERLRIDGNEVRVETPGRFPIADPPSAKLAGAAAAHDVVVAVLRDDAGRERWVEKRWPPGPSSREPVASRSWEARQRMRAYGWQCSSGMMSKGS